MFDFIRNIYCLLGMCLLKPTSYNFEECHCTRDNIIRWTRKISSFRNFNIVTRSALPAVSTRTGLIDSDVTTTCRGSRRNKDTLRSYFYRVICLDVIFLPYTILNNFHTTLDT